jgi:hypothetical protein
MLFAKPSLPASGEAASEVVAIAQTSGNPARPRLIARAFNACSPK